MTQHHSDHGQTWRYVFTGPAHTYYVTAADEVIAKAVASGTQPTIHIYSRDPPGISVGRTRSVSEDVNLEEAAREGVIIVRRKSGGGTIYTDRDCLIYAVACPQKDFSPDSVFASFCPAIIKTLEGFGITCERKLPNDVTLNGRKVSGNAAAWSSGVTLAHGTIMLDGDVERMTRILGIKKPGYVTTVRAETGRLLPYDDVASSLANNLAAAFGANIESGSFTESETKEIERLVRERYSRDEWNYRY